MHTFLFLFLPELLTQACLLPLIASELSTHDPGGRLRRSTEIP